MSHKDENFNVTITCNQLPPAFTQLRFNPPELTPGEVFNTEMLLVSVLVVFLGMVAFAVLFGGMIFCQEYLLIRKRPGKVQYYEKIMKRE